MSPSSSELNISQEICIAQKNDSPFKIKQVLFYDKILFGFNFQFKKKVPHTLGCGVSFYRLAFAVEYKKFLLRNFFSYDAYFLRYFDVSR